MNNDVFIIDTNLKEYNNKNYFNPSKKYPEGLNLNLKSDAQVYDQVRNMFILMELDKENIGTSKWNPFKSFIKKNDHVVIKPNLVKHINKAVDGNTDSLITNFSVIRPIIDYALLALDHTGSLVVGDAPVQECEFEQVITINGLKDAIKEYNANNYVVELIDFRQNNNSNLETVLVNLGSDSALSEVDEYASKYAITNYDLKELHKHHQINKHEYLVPKIILDADVIINLPKPKTHRKAGMTACMKNFIGISCKKEYLPHHRNGSVSNFGDEYPEKSLIKNLKSHAKNYSYKHNPIINFFNRSLSFCQRKLKKDRYLEGSWYGNDTIWRTIIDMNKIVLYASKDGIMQNQKQRIIFNLADMIISGEKEGPLLPTNKEVGLLVASFNCVNADHTIATIMGFLPNKIKYIPNSYALKKYKLVANANFKVIADSKKEVNPNQYNKHFIPTDGWIDYLTEVEK